MYFIAGLIIKQKYTIGGVFEVDKAQYVLIFSKIFG
jgi:hypothetical protein